MFNFSYITDEIGRSFVHVIALVILSITTCLVIDEICNIIRDRDYEFAKLGYVQKVVVIGNPNDSSNRKIQVIWVKKGDEPSVENK